jgi:AraC-like DNA-binding protein
MKPLAHLEIEEVRVPAGHEWVDTAPVWRFVRVETGAAYWLGEERARSLAEGEMLVVAPQIKFVIRASQISEVMLHGFCFASDLLWGFFTVAEQHWLETCQNSFDQVRFLPSTHPITRRFAALAAVAATSPGLSYRAEVLGLVASVFDQDMVVQKPPETSSTAALHRFQQLIAHMPASELINHTPGELARMCHCSPRHFNRLFRRHFKTSTRTKQIELRMLRAQQLLSTTENKISQIARDSGYKNVTLFNTLFKRRFGMTPSSWREQAAKAQGDAATVTAPVDGLP